MNPYYMVLLAVLAFATFIRFENAFFQGLWVDEGRYARAALEIGSHPLSYSVTELWKGQITNFPPVFPYLLMVSSYIFPDPDFAIRVVSPIMGVATVAVSYFFGREMKNKVSGLILAALVAVNPVFWFLSERVLIGVTLTFLYTLTLFCLYYGLEDRDYSRYALWALGPLVVLSILSKQPAYTLGIIIPAYFLYRKKEELVDAWKNGLKESELYKNTLTDRNYYMPIGLGVLFILPWMLRNISVCSFPLCGVQRSLSFATKEGGLDIRGTFFFITNMPTVITLPLTILLGAAVGRYLLIRADRDPDYLIKYFTGLLLAGGVTYFTKIELLPMVVLTSIAFLAHRREEKLLWLAIGVGIGFMSIPVTKVPRYIVFVVPALLGVVSFLLYDFSEWLADVIDREEVDGWMIVAAVVLPLLFISFTQGSAMLAGQSFQHTESAGRWIDANAVENTSIMASSPKQVMFYAYPRFAYRAPDNSTQLRSFIQEKNIGYVAVDIYERAQPDWLMTDIPPYRLPRQTISKLRQGAVSPQEVAQRFKRPPEYLNPVKQFGQSQMPLSRSKQPQMIIYKVNRTGL